MLTLRSYWGVFWIDASNAVKLENGLAQISQYVGKGESWNAAVYWLSRRVKPWLLVLDNADDPDLDLANYLPATGNGHILITTRIQRRTKQANCGDLPLRGMDPEEAISLLLNTAYPKIEPTGIATQQRDLAANIASELGYLALALTHAGATIEKRLLTLEKYLNYYLGYRKKILSTTVFKSAEESNIRSTWEIPFQRIADRPSMEHRDAADLVHYFAFMHFDSIPEKVLSTAIKRGDAARIFNEPRSSLPRRPSQQLDTSDRVQEAVGLLVDYSIVDRDTESGSCSLHPVVHEWARERLNDEEQEQWLEASMAVLAECISPNMEASQAVFRRQLLRHIDSCLAIFKYKFSGLPFPRTHDHCVALERFALVQAENGLWHQAKDLQLKVVEYRHKKLGDWHEDTISAQRTLGEILWNLFDIKAVADIQLSILKRRWFLRPTFSAWLLPWKAEHISYCIALDDLTRTTWLAGRRDWSKYTGERAVNGLTKALGREDPRTLTAMFNLSRTYLHIGMLEKSREMLEWVIEKREHFFGPRHLDTLMAKNELGMVLCAQSSDLDLAETLVSDVLQARTEILGEEHAYTLWSVNDFSKIMCSKKRYDEAATILEEIIPVVERTLGERHVGMAMTRGNLARTYGLCQQWEKAKEVVEQLLEIMPEEHPDRINTMIGYIRLRVRTIRLPEAEKDCGDLLVALERGGQTQKDTQIQLTLELLLNIYEIESREDDIERLKATYPVHFERMKTVNLSQTWADLGF